MKRRGVRCRMPCRSRKGVVMRVDPMSSSWPDGVHWAHAWRRLGPSSGRNHDLAALPRPMQARRSVSGPCQAARWGCGRGKQGRRFGQQEANDRAEQTLKVGYPNSPCPPQPAHSCACVDADFGRQHRDKANYHSKAACSAQPRASRPSNGQQ